MRLALFLSVAGLCVASAIARTPPPAPAISYQAAQATRGSVAYKAKCAQCHGSTLGDGEFGPSLKGGNFRAHFRGRPVGLLIDKLRTMPPGAARSLGDQTYFDVTAYILQVNGVAAGTVALDGKASSAVVPQ